MPVLSDTAKNKRQERYRPCLFKINNLSSESVAALELDRRANAELTLVLRHHQHTVVGGQR